jgi:hypothetical protein
VSEDAATRSRSGVKHLAWFVLAAAAYMLLTLSSPAVAHAETKCPPGPYTVPPGHNGECRPVCDGAATVLTADTVGNGTVGVTANTPYYPVFYDNRGPRDCATSTGATTWSIKKNCASDPTFHCIHWHVTVDPWGVPLPSKALVTATNGSDTFVGWSTSCPSLDKNVNRNVCSVVMDGAKGVTATFGAADTIAPTWPDATPLTVEKVGDFSVKLTWDAADDETWLGGYEIYRDGTLYAPNPRAADGTTTVTLGSQLCLTTYDWQVRAYDSANETASNTVSIDMGNVCPKPPPPGTQLHVWPKRVTRERTAFFHWGPTWRNDQVPTRVKYQCKLDRQKIWKKCFPGKVYRRLQPGKHIFKVRAGNVDGWDKTPANWRWTIKS